jgi:uncharacterized membrane protein
MRLALSPFFREESMTMSRQATMAFVLGIGSLVAVFIGHLALTDISHGEGDLRLEWNVLRICFAAIVAFQVFTLATFWRMIRNGRKLENPGDGSQEGC